MEKWYAIHTKPRQEQLAANNLANQNFRCFFPKIHVWRMRRAKRLLVEEPFFTSYIFLHVDLDQVNTAPIRSTLGVTGFVRFGTYIPPIHDELIDGLIAMADDQGILTQEAPIFTPGQVVLIDEGPLTGYKAIFQAANGNERAMLLIDMLGGKVNVSTPLSALRLPD
ncbi:MAG: transcription/translation regulatory transformer protein RfaH [Magnetococcales bacterium]|nr:transcription/translation regulatory transformer protein RfaH [Magnetococcales bacterium]